jgi:hypothetical protein
MNRTQKKQAVGILGGLVLLFLLNACGASATIPFPAAPTPPNPQDVFEKNLTFDGDAETFLLNYPYRYKSPNNCIRLMHDPITLAKMIFVGAAPCSSSFANTLVLNLVNNGNVLSYQKVNVGEWDSSSNTIVDLCTNSYAVCTPSVNSGVLTGITLKP